MLEAPASAVTADSSTTRQAVDIVDRRAVAVGHVRATFPHGTVPLCMLGDMPFGGHFVERALSANLGESRRISGLGRVVVCALLERRDAAQLAREEGGRA